MSKRQKIVWIIDVLTIVFITIALQSIAVGCEDINDELSLKEKVSLQGTTRRPRNGLLTINRSYARFDSA